MVNDRNYDKTTIEYNYLTRMDYKISNIPITMIEEYKNGLNIGVSAIDLAGNTNFKAYTIYYDNSCPFISLDDRDGSGNYLHGTISDDHLTGYIILTNSKYFTGRANLKNSIQDADICFIPEGVNNIELSAFDSAGNTNKFFKSWSTPVEKVTNYVNNILIMNEDSINTNSFINFSTFIAGYEGKLQKNISRKFSIFNTDSNKLVNTSGSCYDDSYLVGNVKDGNYLLRLWFK